MSIADNKERIMIVMPAYNEEANIEGVIDQWYPKLSLDGMSDDSALVIADGGSSDKTHDILIRLKETRCPNLKMLETVNQFHGPKVIALYDYAIKEGVDYIFQTDSDGQTNPGEFDVFWRERHEYDGQFGNRTVRGDGKDRAFVEKVVCFLVRLFFGVRIPDANAPFRLMRADSVKKYLYKLPADYALPNIMITTYFKYHNERITFREISFKPRTAGVNSVNIPRIIKIGWKTLGEFSKFRKDLKAV